MLKNQYSVDVIGFNPTERIVLASVFGLAARRSPKFAQHGNVAEQADIFLVDGSDANAVLMFRQRNPDKSVPSIFIGESDHGTGFAVLSRPLQWTKLFKAFDQAALLCESVGAGALVAAPPMPAYPADSTEPTMAFATALDQTQPMHAGGAPTVDSIAPDESAAYAAPNTAADWVLVVDDSATIREFMKSKLAPFQLNVDFAESGEQAAGLAGQKHYTCIFLDVVLPGIDGYYVCKLIKAKRGVSKSAVVLVTSKNSMIDKIRGAMAGCDAYLTKPIHEEKLLETIVKYLPPR